MRTRYTLPAFAALLAVGLSACGNDADAEKEPTDKSTIAVADPVKAEADIASLRQFIKSNAGGSYAVDPVGFARLLTEQSIPVTVVSRDQWEAEGEDPEAWPIAQEASTGPVALYCAGKGTKAIFLFQHDGSPVYTLTAAADDVAAQFVTEHRAGKDYRSVVGYNGSIENTLDIDTLLDFAHFTC